MHRRRKEEQVNEHLITANRRRDLLVSARLMEKLTTLLTNPGGAWADPSKHYDIFWKLDVWEDDSRRRKRFVQNPYGCHHSAARLKSAMESKSSAIEVLLYLLGHPSILLRLWMRIPGGTVTRFESDAFFIEVIGQFFCKSVMRYSFFVRFRSNNHCEMVHILIPSPSIRNFFRCKKRTLLSLGNLSGHGYTFFC
ncbi:unnamed protein product [Gongylonema pulchrum]|uniref:DUF1088 domain-containing protein n=1 Tax=Gongylonema pulchrum TaxID=637853 RepID=A0A183DHG5_9BILA|nr:unnamed protein product [Gongylonema pulchrum]